MKRAVSVSIGSSKRDKSVEVELMGEKVRIERIGTDGDMEKAARLFQEMDGKVDALGVGGADLGMLVDGNWYPIHSAQSLVRHVRQTPVVDGAGLKTTLEYRVGVFLDEKIGRHLQEQGRKALVTIGLDRWGMTMAFVESGYECVFGDFMFALGIPIPVRSPDTLKTLAGLLVPLITRLPFAWLYPTGEKQEQHQPKWERYYRWATVIAGDCHYIKRHMPNQLPDKVIVTNTTTPSDVDRFRDAGVKYLVTTTPVFEGRSFGTNMMEAALIAVSGEGRALTPSETNTLLDQLGFEPQLMELN
jgi:hypothetical protein